MVALDKSADTAVWNIRMAEIVLVRDLGYVNMV
jgi:hypothetical protein